MSLHSITSDTITIISFFLYNSTAAYSMITCLWPTIMLGIQGFESRHYLFVPYNHVHGEDPLCIVFNH